MFTNTYDLQKIKKMLCDYYSLNAAVSNITVSRKNIFGLKGDNKHFNFIVESKNRKCRAFGRTSSNIKNEYRILQCLDKRIPKNENIFTRPIGRIEYGHYSLLLFNYLEGYSNLSWVFIKSIFPFRDVVSRITKLGFRVIDRIYYLQSKYFETNLGDVSAEYEEACKQLDEIQSISDRTKNRINTELSKIIRSIPMVRKGIIHSDLGLRNIMISNSNVLFMDWEDMKTDSFFLLDPCFFVNILLMRSVQVFIHKKKVDFLSKTLFQYIRNWEEKVAEPQTKQFINNSLKLGKYITMIKILWSFENKPKQRKIINIIKRRRRQINYLISSIEEKAYSE